MVTPTRCGCLQARDLSRLIEFYRVWAHSLFPNYKFADFIDVAEKLCRSRRCKVWRLHGEGVLDAISDAVLV